jgi:hypothetical protein
MLEPNDLTKLVSALLGTQVHSYLDTKHLPDDTCRPSVHLRRYAETFLRSTLHQHIMEKLSCDPSKLGGSQESFLRSTQFGRIARKNPSKKKLDGFRLYLREVYKAIWFESKLLPYLT